MGKLDLQCTNFWISGPAGGTLKGAAGEIFWDFVGLNVNCTENPVLLVSGSFDAPEKKDLISDLGMNRPIYEVYHES
jgi:hypothetical protein